MGTKETRRLPLLQEAHPSKACLPQSPLTPSLSLNGCNQN
uniref:Uncharacterized protein n=1 Tax=Rhizophora mucronata TaxID=61149 RepID=A0A2P2R520_RHIMU